MAENEHQEKVKESRRRRDLTTAWGIAVGSLVALIISTLLWLNARYQEKRAELNQADSLARYSLSLFSQGQELGPTFSRFVNRENNIFEPNSPNPFLYKYYRPI